MISEKIGTAFTAGMLRKLLSNSRRSLWVGALSFEDRCIGSLAAIEKEGLQVTRGLALDYTTRVHPLVDDEKRRATNWQRISKLGSTMCAEEMEQIKVDPYSFQALQETLEGYSARSQVDLAIIDITCMTKIHTLALSASLSRVPETFKWVVAYSTPENYGNLGDMHKGLGWRDIIMAPLAETALLFNEASSRGIIMTGHEADRLIVALAELEPSGGVIIVAKTEKRPDLRKVSERLNRKVVRQLTRMRSTSWAREVVGITDMKKMRECVTREIGMAREHAAPVILFPYGPKSLLFVASFQLASEYPAASWFVYPIPSAYDVDYSEGIESTMWLVPQASCP